MRRNMSEEEKQKRIKVREFLKQNPISSSDDLNTFFKDMMKVMIEMANMTSSYQKTSKYNWSRLRS